MIKMNEKERIIIKSLNKLGVDTRYVSLYEDDVYINNLKFSKFSRKKEEQFNQLYPNSRVIRSKLFQKISIKVSRTIKNQIKPKEIIYIEDDNTPESILLFVLMDAYKRKYGITIANNEEDASKLLSTKCINDFAEEYVDLMIAGNKISNHLDENTIYPLLHIDYQWIIDWIDSTSINHIQKNKKEKTMAQDIIEFLNTKIPNVQESMTQSVKYLDENRLDKNN